MEAERLSILKASIEAQKREIERIFAKIEERRRGEGGLPTLLQTHAYSYELDPKKVALVAEDALKLRELYRQEIERFLDELRS